MDLYLKVRHAHFEDGLSGRQIARDFGISRDSVSKMLAYSEPPGYRRTAPIKRPKLDPCTGQIDQWLSEDKARPRKQRHTAKRIFERLRDECGFDGGYAPIVEAVKAQLDNGSAFSVGTEIEVEYAEQLVARSPSFDKLRFVNSGTEAVMSCLKAARAYTGRPKIAKVEGAYHGLYYYAEVSQTSKPANWGDADAPSSVPVARGTPQSALDDVVVIPFNDADRAIAILNRHKDSIAGVLLDLLPHRIGVIPALDTFVQALRTWATTNGALLIFDEVITFRTHFSGAQQAYSARPDLTALGKMIGGGFPVGALAGRAEVLDVMNPLNGPAPFPHYGTFSANPVTLTAGSIAMAHFDEAAVVKLNALADKTRAGIAEAIKIADVPACVTGRGSMFRIHLKETEPTTYRDAFITPDEQKSVSALLDHYFNNGLIMIETCSGLLSTPMTQSEIDRLCQVTLDGLRKIKPTL